VRFRYQLEGAEDRWVDAGARRTAAYSNLGPGHYRFRVIATNNDGVWNRTGAVLDFQIKPTFVQSWPFRLLCGVALLGLLWLAYSMRLRAVAHRIGQRMAERVEERERIARELHDTLLQAVQSLTLRFQLAVDDLPPKAAARTSLIEAIDTADRVIADGRDRVRELRSQQDGDLEQIICDLIARLELGSAIDVALTVTGPQRQLDPLALEEVTRIAGEALFNVRRHAKASRLTIEIRHGSSFNLRVVDNGVGIDPTVAADGGKAGHYGLVGMVERARKLRGRLIVHPDPNGGTELSLTLPGSIAYQAKERGILARIWRSRR
jgi:signal transduction histidine kinase